VNVNRTKTIFVVATATAALAAAVAPQPTPAVVHEIYAAWCAGHGEIEPPGLSDADKQSFARPVFAGGLLSFTPYLDGILIDWDFDRPQSKIIPAPTGPAIVQIGPGLYLERFIVDPSFVAFLHCRRLQDLSG
jgi:hypothetical protein